MYTCRGYVLKLSETKQKNNFCNESEMLLRVYGSLQFVKACVIDDVRLCVYDFFCYLAHGMALNIF